MSDELLCEQVRELAPELALDIADGQERDAALRHVAGCAECRGLVTELSSVTDELLLLAPTHEPPLGFESRVLARLAEPTTRHRSWAAALLVAAGFVLSVALGAGSVFQATSSDRRLADSYRSVLNEGQGSFFAAAPLGAQQGRLGTAWGYQGRPSWVFVTLQVPIGDPHHFRVWLVTRDGRRVPLGEAVLGGGHSGWGKEIPVDLGTVRELRFEQVDGPLAFTATFNS